MSPNRIVAFLTPLLFAPAAGAASAWLAKHFPGTDIKSADLQAIFIGGSLIALAPAAQWLHGWQKHEARQADFEHEIELANAGAGGSMSALLDTGSDLDDDADLDLGSLDALDDLQGADDLDADLLVGDEEASTVT
jgi:hypothetical protein